MNTLTIRADCSSAIGTGHVMRMIALGQAWQDLGGKVQFVGETTPLHRRLRKEGFTIVPISNVYPAPTDLKTLLDATSKNDWVAIDGYHFDTAYQQAMRAAGRKTLVVDDICDREQYCADILLNQNPDAGQYTYPINDDAICLLGSTYALLRNEFIFPETQLTKPLHVKNVIVTLGGADVGNMTSTVINALASLKNCSLHVKIVAGAANPNLPELKEKTQENRFELLYNPKDLAFHMRWADLAVTASGSTCWELCHIGIPMIAIETAANQHGVQTELIKKKIAICFEQEVDEKTLATTIRSLVSDHALRSLMRRNGQRLIDGKGSERCALSILRLSTSLRPVKNEDCRQLFDWRNDPIVREKSFNPQPLIYCDHEKWFFNKIKDSNCLFFIAEAPSGQALGQFRFDLKGNEALVSIIIAPTMHGKGLGTTITKMACQRLGHFAPNATAVAMVKAENQSSATMFKKAGFLLVPNNNSDDLRFEWKNTLC